MATKIDIFSGFLGAGKTTLIKKLIRESFQGQQVVLIENEFGEIGIDGGFLEESGIKINELNAGCICCSLVGDFREALRKVVDQYHPDRILIEPSGVGKLSDVTRAVEAVAEHLDVELSSFVTVADVNKVKLYMKNFGEFYNDQVSHASCILLSRTRGADAGKVAAAVALLREKNPTATIVTTPWDDLTGGQILEAMSQKDDFVAQLLASITTIITTTRTACAAAATITTTATRTMRTSTSTTTIMTTSMRRKARAATTTTTSMTTTATRTTTTSTATAAITTIMATTPTRCSPAGASRRPAPSPAR